jgi:GT2 family glycosyltransferase
MRHTWVLVLSYTYPEGLKRTLDSLKLTTNESISIKVILNGVNKDDYKFVFERDDIEEIINLEENIGFLRAYNKAILTLSTSDHFVILNDDVEIKDGRWLTSMYEKMYNSEVPKNQDPHTWNKQIGIVGFRQEALLPTAEGKKENQKTNRWVLSCALVNPIAVRMAGLFDERYFCWWGDFEFLCRLHGAGYKVSSVDEEYIYHERQHTFKDMRSYDDSATWQLLDAMAFYEQCYNRHFEWKEAMPFPINQILTEVKWYLRNKLTYIREGRSIE